MESKNYTQSYIADPRSTKEIRGMTLNLRTNIGYNTPNKKEFPILNFLEFVMPIIHDDFAIDVCDKKQMGNIHGLACPEEKCIRIREDVYEGAYNGNGRDRFTLAHELGHYLMHGKEHVKLARVQANKKLEAFKNPEWQANTFAAELLMPITLLHSDNPFKIASDFGVSLSAANFRVKKIYKH